MTKQLIHLIGALITAAVLAVGIGLLGLQLFGSATALNASADAAVAENANRELVITGLRAQQGKYDELDAALGTLREELPAMARADDVVALAAEAATATNSRLTDVTVSSVSPYSARTAPTPEAAEAPTEVPADPAAPQQQVAMTVKVETPSIDAADAFIDALRAGPRVVSVTQAVAKPAAASGPLTLDVNLVTYFTASPAAP